MKKDNYFRLVDSLSRFVLIFVVVIGIFVAVDTADRIGDLEDQVRKGNCSYLLDTGYIEVEKMNNTFNYSTAESFQYNETSRKSGKKSWKQGMSGR